jgi:HD-like signal output (HDOD) protein
VRSLVETVAVKDMFGTPGGGVGAALQQAWRAQVTSACVARAVAEGTGILDPEEAYLMTLFRDVGELFLVGVMGDLGSGGLGAPELAMIEGWHPRFGAALLAKWGMGRRFKVVAQNHQARFVGEPGDVQCLHLVHVAGHLTAHLVQTLDGSVPLGPDLADSYKALSLTGREVEALVARMPELYQEAIGLAA